MDINVINKDNLPTASIKDFKPLQGSLKTLSDENYNKLKKSIEKYGFFVPIFVWNGYIMDGHGRREVIIGEGWDIKVPYVNIEAEDVEEAKDKLLHITSQYNTITIDGLEEFRPEWEQLGVKFDAITVSKLEPKLEAKEDDFDTTPPEQPQTVLGDLYEIGEHRLLCGDSTDIDQVEKLMNGEKADMVFTDPPYNVDYSNADRPKPSKTDLGKIKNDVLSDDDFIYFLKEVYKRLDENTKDNSSFYIWYADKSTIQFYSALLETNIEFKQLLIWKKPMLLGRSKYQWAHEPCIFAIKGSPYFTEDRTKTTVWDFGGYDKSKNVHPTQKPLFLPIEAIKNSSKNNDTVLDLFGGSGSTLIACEQLNRNCYMMELDPKYCDVIVTRMLKLDPSLTIKRNGEVIEW